MPLWPWPLWFSVLLDAAVVAWIASRQQDPPARIVAMLAAAATVWLANLALLVGLGLTFPFGLLHLLYLDLVVALPLVGLAVATRAGRYGNRVRLLGVACMLAAPVGAYASFVEPSRLRVERADVAVAAERLGSKPVRVGALADLQMTRVGEHEREAVDRLMALSPDLILIAGDIHQGSARVRREELPALRDLMRRLDAPGGVFFVEGDTEGPGEADEVLAGSGVALLRNELRTVRVGDRQITLGGVELDYRSAEARATIARLEEGRADRPERRGDSDIRILLTHRPDPVLDLAAGTHVDLVVAGHTHGGQVQLPLIGPPITFSRVPRDIAAGGLHELGQGRRIYVSRGVGLERNQAPRVRFGAIPEISLLTLVDDAKR